MNPPQKEIVRRKAAPTKRKRKTRAKTDTEAKAVSADDGKTADADLRDSEQPVRH